MALILLMLPRLKLPYLDKKTDSYFSHALTEAGLAYGVCRAINASVSVMKDSQVQIEPAGLGVSLAVGEILDPLDDMTERASDLLIAIIVGLGVQKIAYELSVAFAPLLLGFGILAFVITSFFRGDRAVTLGNIIIKLIILIAIARLCLPLTSIISSYINEHYFFPEINQVTDKLKIIPNEINRLTDMSILERGGLLDTFKIVSEKTTDLWGALKSFIQNASSMVSHLLNLSYLFAAQFIFEVILLPISIFWSMSYIFKLMFKQNLNLCRRTP